MILFLLLGEEDDQHKYKINKIDFINFYIIILKISCPVL